MTSPFTKQTLELPRSSPCCKESFLCLLALVMSAGDLSFSWALPLSLSLPYPYPSASSSSTKSSPMTPSWRPSLPSPSTSPFLHDPSPIHIHVGLVSDMLTAGGCCSFGRFSDFPPAEIPKMVLYPCCLTINSAEFNRCGFNIAWKSKLMYGKFMYINIDLKIDTAGNESNGPMFRCNTHTYISWTTSAMQIYIIHVCVKHFQ